MKGIISVVVFLFLLVTPSFAQESLKIDTQTPTPVPSVSYALPYPGLLPDNPFYLLKAARDRIVSFFIADPVKKAEFDLLQADKRLQAGLFLLHKEDPDVGLAITTISKGQNYLHEAITGLSTIQREDPSVKDTLGTLPDKLYTAAQKHDELLHKEADRFDGEKKEDFSLLLKRSREYIQLAGSVAGK